MGQNRYDIIVPSIDGNDNQQEIANQSPVRTKLVQWITVRVDEWREYRDSNYKARWEEYYRLWRGIWHSEDKTRESERSKLISPALQQAIEASVGELEEATFGKGKWFDISDDVEDKDRKDMEIIKSRLFEDMEYANVPDAICEAYLNGAIYGTGIAKIIVEQVTKKKPVAAAIGFNFGSTFEAMMQEEVVCRLEAIPPDQFVIDPTARTIDEALGCAHEMVRPKYSIEKKQSMGVYFDTPIGAFIDDIDVSGKGEQKSKVSSDKVKITEYAGMIPRRLLEAINPSDSSKDDSLGDVVEKASKDEDLDLVEALVTIANDAILLKAVENPFTMMDRPYVAYQHDTVPNRFWGRGVAEKGYNPQKALDAELRARIDGMALTIHPMIAADGSRLPRGMNFSVRPGRTVLTNGNPKDVIMPFNFGQVSPNTFHQSGDLERMIQMGTGAMDSATPVGISPRNNTASGMSMIASGAIKRSKRTMQNIERNFLIPIIDKFAWRYMQFDPNRYPASDTKFMARSTMGIMAREFEQQQLTNLLQAVPPESPAHWILLKGIIDNSSMDNKEEMMQVMDQLLQQSLHPQPPPPDPRIQVDMQKLQLQAQEMKAKQAYEAKKLQIDEGLLMIKKMDADIKARQQHLEESLAVAEDTKTKAQAILAIAQAEAQKVASNIDQYAAQMQSLQDNASIAIEHMKTKHDMAMAEKDHQLQKSQQSAQESKDTSDKNDAKILTAIQALTAKVISLESAQNEKDDSNELKPVLTAISQVKQEVEQLAQEINKPKKIVRDKQGKVVSVNGKSPKRNSSTGLIEEI